MKYTKRTYALPANASRRFEPQPGQRSGVVAEKWLSERERQALRQSLAEGLEDMADIYREVEQEFNAIDEELHRAVKY